MSETPAPETMERAPIVIAIIGAGASGTLVASHLLRQTELPVHIYLFEKGPHADAVGTAYGTPYMEHLLNVPTGKMSAFPDAPTHFLDWVGTHKADLGLQTGDFAPRRVYGEYLASILAHAEAHSAPGNSFERIQEEVTSINILDGVAELRTASHRAFNAERCVLAIGNFSPNNVRITTPSAFHNERYIGNPWRRGQLEQIAPEDRVLLIGTGLTTVDVLLTLTNQNGRSGMLTAFSRHGVWPTAHAPADAYADFLKPLVEAEVLDLTNVFAAVKAEMKKNGALQWRAIIDAIRPYTQRIWHGWSEAERERFSRHLNHRWGVARHRMPGHIAERLAELTREGKMETLGARLIDIEEHGTSLTAILSQHGSPNRLECEWIVNCTGPHSNYERLNEPLIQSLRSQGLIQPDALRFGVETTAEGRVVYQDGRLSEVLFTLGPPMKGTLFECTAMPEIKGQAADLAKLLVQNELKAPAEA